MVAAIVNSRNVKSKSEPLRTNNILDTEMSTRLSQHTFDNSVPRAVHAVPRNGDGVAAPTDLVYLHHPGYEDDDESLLFTMPTCSMNQAGESCAEYLVAWQGCYALAVEQPGFFTTQRMRTSDRVQYGQGLAKGHHWYHLEEHVEGEMYATLLEFRAWRYSPEKMPENWPGAVPWRDQEDEDQEDGDCGVTGEDGAVQKAHLVENTEWRWWMENNMMDHAALSGATRATEAIGQETTVPGNLIALSDRLHRLWDRNFFCVFSLRVADGTWRLHCIFLQPQEKSVRNLVSSICRKYESTFLAKAVKRYLGGSKAAANWVEGDDILQQRQDKVRNTIPKKKSRSGSPRKRAYFPAQDDGPGVREEGEDYTWHRNRVDGESEGDAERTGGSERDSAVDVYPYGSPGRGRPRVRGCDKRRAIPQELGDAHKKRRKFCDVMAVTAEG